MPPFYLTRSFSHFIRHDQATCKKEELQTDHLPTKQIKNSVSTAQALAVNVKEKLSMLHIKRVLDVSEAFDRDLKGGKGYEDAMKSYF